MIYPDKTQAVCDHIAEWLARKGILYAFGIIGGGNIKIWDAIARLGKTELISCHHEQAATMAAAFANSTDGRILAVALVTTGAGSANAITGAVSAFMDSRPLLIISGNENAPTLLAGTRVLGVQGYDSTAVAKHFTKRAERVTHPRAWLGVLESAYFDAIEPRKGPCWVDVPKDIQGAIA